MSSSSRPQCIGRWQTLEEPDKAHYRGSDERMGIGAPLGRALGLTRIGIHHTHTMRLLPS